MIMFAVVVPAAGRSTRFGDAGRKKIFADLNGRPVWLRTVEAFARRKDVGQIIVAIAPDDREQFLGLHQGAVGLYDLTLVDGGAERVDSVAAALDVLSPEIQFVAVHDAARPCVEQALIDRVFNAARQHGAALPGMAVSDTLKRVANGIIVETVPRAHLYAVQTPQAFRRDWFVQAYQQRASASGPTDDAQLVEAIGHACHVVEGSPLNLKITHAHDLPLARIFLDSLPREESRPGPHPFHAEPTDPGPADRSIRIDDLFS